jgi:hypothetical protein
MIQLQPALPIVVLLTNLIAVDAYAKRVVSCPIDDTSDFVYYSGSGATRVSQSWIVHFLDWRKVQDPAIDYQDLSAREMAACDLGSYPDLDMYIQPGGDA